MLENNLVNKCKILPRCLAMPNVFLSLECQYLAENTYKKPLFRIMGRPKMEIIENLFLILGLGYISGA